MSGVLLPFPQIYPPPRPEEYAVARAAAAPPAPPVVYPPPPPERRTISARDVERLNPLTFSTGRSIEELLAAEEWPGS